MQITISDTALSCGGGSGSDASTSNPKKYHLLFRPFFASADGWRVIPKRPGGGAPSDAPIFPASFGAVSSASPSLAHTAEKKVLYASIAASPASGDDAVSRSPLPSGAFGSFDPARREPSFSGTEVT